MSGAAWVCFGVWVAHCALQLCSDWCRAPSQWPGAASVPKTLQEEEAIPVLQRAPALCSSRVPHSHLLYNCGGPGALGRALGDSTSGVMPPWHGLSALAIVTPVLFARRKHWAPPAMQLQRGFPPCAWACCWPWPSGASEVPLLLFIPKPRVQNHGASWELLPAPSRCSWLRPTVKK